MTSDSGQVETNTAPTTPASITIPNNVEGGASITVTWSAATDAENNLVGYAVERSVDGREMWTQVYQGSTTTTNNTVPAGSATVMYWVKAYDSEGLYSTYRNSAQVSVFNAPGAPGGITAPENVLGGTSLTVTWSAASDVDGDPVTVTEAIDGVTLRTFSANLGGNNTFAVTGDTFFKLLNGAHTLTASATDGQATTVHKLTFTKEVTTATITLAEPMEADDKISICVLSVAGDIPADAEFKVEVTNNANDDTPVWGDFTVEVKNGGNHIFRKRNRHKRICVQLPRERGAGTIRPRWFHQFCAGRFPVMVTRRADSIKELNKRKTNEQLAKENAEPRAQVENLQEQAKEQADALIELAAMIAGEE